MTVYFPSTWPFTQEVCDTISKMVKHLTIGGFRFTTHNGERWTTEIGFP